MVCSCTELSEVDACCRRGDDARPVCWRARTRVASQLSIIIKPPAVKVAVRAHGQRVVVSCNGLGEVDACRRGDDAWPVCWRAGTGAASQLAAVVVTPAGVTTTAASWDAAPVPALQQTGQASSPRRQASTSPKPLQETTTLWPWARTATFTAGGLIIMDSWDATLVLALQQTGRASSPRRQQASTSLNSVQEHTIPWPWARTATSTAGG